MTIFTIIIWLAIAALIVRSKPFHARKDCWWIAALWPCALALVAGILFYELAIYRTIVRPIVRARSRRTVA